MDRCLAVSALAEAARNAGDVGNVGNVGFFDIELYVKKTYSQKYVFF